MYGKLAVLNLGDSGRQIGEKLFALLSPGQKKDLVQFVRDYEAGNIPVDVPCTTLFRGQYFIPPQADQPLTEIPMKCFWNWYGMRTIPTIPGKQSTIT